MITLAKISKIIGLDIFLEKQVFFIQEVLNNKIFIYPTDTIYGIGMLSTPQNMEKINKIKLRKKNTLISVIAPNQSRIQSNYKFPDSEKIITDENFSRYLEKYNGVTFIFDPIIFGGVRILKHPFQEFVNKLGQPFITTSVNISGNPVCLDPNKIPAEILKYVDYVIDDGVLDASASTLVNLVSGEIIER